jgi:hypothetical protein
MSAQAGIHTMSPGIARGSYRRRVSRLERLVKGEAAARWARRAHP